ncbi:uncharacterized protein LOC109817390 [Cajanus cajan]|uniref:Uncharacterized protein n=1 Tax=Cajanus cajan TaxID=3821 RepID=A0A151RMR9_CAJCA|nr:uncharacterized protein LOC109817390 [Cajanus cajan]KYP43818.1 hypothetical protein KK1_034739 [Cajanus cajan]
MWNCCMRNNQVSAQDENEEGKKKVEEMKVFSSFKLEPAKRKDCLKKKVRFELQDNEGGSDGNSRSGPVRIRLVVTKQELKRMLRNKNENDLQYTSLEHLLSDMVLREKRVCEIGKYGGSINSWRPALESIPEER